MPTISFIIPMYNVEKFIEKCVLSILQQNISAHDYEIVVVNDGTKDNSRNIVLPLLQKHPNIKMIDQENMGLSAARNTGLAVATGEYIWFIDSDDYIANNTVHKILRLLQAKTPDLLYMGHKKVYENSKKEKNVGKCSGKTNSYTNGQFLKAFKSFPPMVWVYIYRRTMLTRNYLNFLEGVLHEDEEFTPKALFFAKKILHLDEPIYCYLKRESSITSTTSNSLLKINSKQKICNSLAAFARKHEMSDEFMAYFSRLINRLATDVLDLCMTDKKPELFKENINQLKDNGLYPLSSEGSPGIMNSLSTRYKMVKFNRYLRQNQSVPSTKE